MNLFGRPKPKKAPKVSDAIQRLREAQDTLEKREAHIQRQIEQCVIEAKKKSRAKDKRGALFNLKRKAQYQKQIDQIYGKKTNLDIQIMALENAAMNNDMVEAMVQGRNTLQATVGDAQIEKAQDVMEDITESIAMADELGEALSTEIGPQFDEDELEDELKELEDEMADEDILALDTPSVPVTQVPQEQQLEKEPELPPIAPSGGLETAAEKEAKELAALEAMMFA